MSDGTIEERTELRGAGLRVTHHRVALLSALRLQDGHATAEALRESVAAGGTRVPLPTVYAVLADLVRVGIVSDLRGEGGVIRFDANVARHHHLSCTQCGALSDVPCSDVDDGDPCLALPESRGWRLERAEVTFRGLCPACVLPATTRRERSRGSTAPQAPQSTSATECQTPISNELSRRKGDNERGRRTPER